jgi:AcrR family transcriptional regulator
MTGTPGRPLSAELSEQLLSVAVDILAEEGWGRLNSDRIAARAHAGKAGIYRRWPTMAVLARDAVARFSLVATPADEGSLRGDLAALVARWSRPLDREERAAASIVGAARHEEELRAGLDAALVRPLRAVVAEIGARAAARGEPVSMSRLALLGSVLEAFWWQRYTAAGDGAMVADQIDRVVDDVLVPIVAPSSRSEGPARNGVRSEVAAV